MYRKWFDAEGVEWTPICELIVHPNAAAYTQMTGVPTNSPGHSRIESDPSGRVTARRLDLRMDIAGMMDAVLPHETTHVVLAGMFDSFHVPRWADEGIAVLSEPDTKIDQHRRNLLKNQKEGHLFGLKELMELKDYPHPRQIGAFYAQSVVLVEFLVHGVKYAFPPDRGTMTRGTPTAYAAPPMNKEFVPDSDPPPVWPDPDGTVRGLAFSPLTRGTPKAARQDPALYEVLALVDAIRDGRVRERRYAEKELTARLAKPLPPPPQG